MTPTTMTNLPGHVKAAIHSIALIAQEPQHQQNKLPYDYSIPIDDPITEDYSSVLRKLKIEFQAQIAAHAPPEWVAIEKARIAFVNGIQSMRAKTAAVEAARAAQIIALKEAAGFSADDTEAGIPATIPGCCDYLVTAHFRCSQPITTRRRGAGRPSPYCDEHHRMCYDIKTRPTADYIFKEVVRAESRINTAVDDSSYVETLFVLSPSTDYDY